MKRYFMFCIAASFCVATLFCGCAGNSNSYSVSESNKPLEMGSKLQFPDIPVPFGFKLLASKSYAHEAATFRFASLKYEGEEPIDEVVNFYKNQMVVQNWKLERVEGLYTYKVLHFTNKKESCIVHVSNRKDDTRIEIQINRLNKK